MTKAARILEVIQIPLDPKDRDFTRKAFNRMCEDIRISHKAAGRKIRTYRSERYNESGTKIQQLVVKEN